MKSRAFTLIELLVVVLIIGILSAIALPQYTRAVQKTRYVKAIIAAEDILKAAESFYLANGAYPLDFNSLEITLPSVVPTATLADGSVVEVSAAGISRCILSTGTGDVEGTHIVCMPNDMPAMYGIWFRTKGRFCIANQNAEADVFCQRITGKKTSDNWGVWTRYRFDS